MNTSSSISVAEPDVIPEPEYQAEPARNLTANVGAETEDVAQPEMMPSPATIVVPTILLLLLIVTSIIWLILRRRCKARSKRYLYRPKRALNSVCPEVWINADSTDFLSPFDLEVLDNLEKFYNRTNDLLILCTPALASILQAPLVMFMYPYFTKLMWPTHESPPNVNDAIACFLMPAGLVYATVFGAAFSTANGKLAELQAKFVDEVSMLDQIYTLAMRLNLNVEQKLEICKALKAETIYMILQMQRRSPGSFKNKPGLSIKDQLWTIIEVLKSVPTGSYVNQSITQQIMKNMLSLNSICSDNDATLTARIHPVKWAFLEILGFFSFFGVALIETYSMVLSMIICMITVFSISILCFVIADLDNPFSGFFRLDLSLLNAIVMKGINWHQQLSSEQRDKCVKACSKEGLAKQISVPEYSEPVPIGGIPDSPLKNDSILKFLPV